MFFIIFFTVSINHGTNFSIEQFPIPALLGLKCVNHPVALLPEEHEGVFIYKTMRLIPSFIFNTLKFISSPIPVFDNFIYVSNCA